MCVQSFFPRLLGHCWVEGYATGNFSAAQAAELAACVQSLLVGPHVIAYIIKATWTRCKGRCYGWYGCYGW